MSTHSELPSSHAPAGAALPEVILNYIAAANDGRIDEAVACFAQDARVHDEDHDHQGLDEIREWIAETTESSQPQNKVLSSTGEEGTYTVISEISGNFPGSPVELEFHYGITNGKISSLSIQ